MVTILYYVYLSQLTRCPSEKKEQNHTAIELTLLYVEHAFPILIYFRIIYRRQVNIRFQ